MLKERDRLIYFFMIIVVMLMGLSTRYFSKNLPRWIILYAGDTLWALMIFLIIGFLFKKFSSIKVALFAAIFSVSIEMSQLYSAPWIDGLRKTKIGGLILGYGFLWSDILCYILGIAIGVCLEKLYYKNRSQS